MRYPCSHPGCALSRYESSPGLWSGFTRNRFAEEDYETRGRGAVVVGQAADDRYSRSWYLTIFPILQYSLYHDRNLCLIAIHLAPPHFEDPQLLLWPVARLVHRARGGGARSKGGGWKIGARINYYKIFAARRSTPSRWKHLNFPPARFN